MARPKKSKPPEETDKQVTQEESMQETLEQLGQKGVLNELALGISKTNDGWAVIEIAYNSESGESDLNDIHLAGISRDDAIELFKITAVEKGLV